MGPISPDIPRIGRHAPVLAGRARRDLTQAMLYAGQQFDWYVGSGGFWLFSKLDGEWTEAGE